MSPSRTLTLAAACLALVIPAGCATSPTMNSQHRTRLAPDPEALAEMERQMLNTMLSGGVHLGASDNVGRSLYDRHAAVTLVRHMRETDPQIAGADTSFLD